MRRLNPKSVWLRVSLFATLFVLLFLAPVADAATGTSLSEIPREKQLVAAAVAFGVVLVVMGLLIAVAKATVVRLDRQIAKLFDTCLADAKQKALETNNFSEAWVKSAAHVGWKVILKDQRETERREARRQLRVKDEEQSYAEVAEYARTRYGLNESEIVDMLRKADELPYRLVKHAIAKAEEVAHGA